MKNPVSHKKLFLVLSVLAVCIVFAVIALCWYLWPTPELPDAYVYQSGEDHFVIRPDGRTVKLPDTTSLTDYQFDPCAKYLYYLEHHPQTDDSPSVGTLYRVDYRKLTGNAKRDRDYVQKIAEQADWLTLQFSDDGDTVLYRTTDDTLYVYDQHRSTKLAGRVTDAWFDEHRIAYTTHVSGCHKLYVFNTNTWAIPVLLAEDYLSLITKDLDDLFYTKHRNPATSSLPSLYRLTVDGEPLHIAETGFVANYGNRVYYTVSGPGYYNLYCYDNGNCHTVAYASGLGIYFPASHLPLCFNTAMDMSPTGTCLRFVNRDSGQIVRLSAPAAASFREIHNQYSAVAPVAVTDDALFVADHALPSYTNISSLWVAPVQDDTTGDFTEITTDHRNVGTPFALNNTLYYMEKHPTSYITHFRIYQDGTSTRILENVNRVLLYEDGSLLAHRGGAATYTLLFVDASGRTTTIAENVTKEWRISKDKILYLRDGHLYEFDGNESTRLAENVSSVRSADSMTPVNTW
jgi:hypothetical protein